MTDRKTKEGRFVAALFAVFIIGFYLFSAYSKLFDTQGAFLYDPKSGALYSVQMAPSHSEHYKWRVFIPFFSAQHTEPVYGDLIGNLGELLEEASRRERLYEQDPDAWHEAMTREIEGIAALTASSGDIKFWNIAIFYRAIELQPEHIPGHLKAALRSRGLEGLRLVDAVVSESSLSLDDMNESTPPILKTITDGVLLQGVAANVLHDAIGYH